MNITKSTFDRCVTSFSTRKARVVTAAVIGMLSVVSRLPDLSPATSFRLPLASRSGRLSGADAIGGTTMSSSTSIATTSSIAQT